MRDINLGWKFFSIGWLVWCVSRLIVFLKPEFNSERSTDPRLSKIKYSVKMLLSNMSFEINSKSFSELFDKR